MTIFIGYQRGVMNNHVNISISIRFPTSLKNTLTDENIRQSPIVNRRCVKRIRGKKMICHLISNPKMKRNGIKTIRPSKKLIRLDKIFEIGNNSLGK